MEHRNHTKMLLAVINTLLLIVITLSYLYFDPHFDKSKANYWHDYILPIACSVQATLIAILIAYLFLDGVRRSDAAEAQAKLKQDIETSLKDQMSKIEERFEKKAQDACITLMASFLTKTNNQTDTDSIKEPEVQKSTKRQK
ncbi:hypothetical protein OH491_16715 [Termitidicoccus mucosus]|uniref:Uncharacterized protein n=1 Tax=Termitidicoccus mucosus TaxID=1184151 RepID=A0A178IIZ3_9BACT|nr:hypothetical protein AW736_11880 [Opitutaceae bacterium TSB47]